MSTALDIVPLEQSDDLCVWGHEGRSDTLIACFTGVGQDESKVLGYEFAQSATQSGRHHALFFADQSRSWLNAPDLIERIVIWIEECRDRLGVSQVVAMGHSMGAFSAAVLPAFTRIATSLCFSPQTTLHPELAPDEDRWPQYQDRIGSFRIRTVADYVVPDTRYYVLFGKGGREAPQRARFPLRENIQLYVLPRMSHLTARRLKAAGLLDQVVQYAVKQKDFALYRVLTQKMNAELVDAPTPEMQRFAADDAARLMHQEQRA